MAKRGGSVASKGEPAETVKENHPLTELFPVKADPMELSMRIAHEGLREPIYLYEKKIIEGRGRYAACLELGITPQFKDWVMIRDRPKHVVDWMLRRHVAQHNPSRLERIQLGAKLLPYYKEMRGKTREMLAEALDLGYSTMQMVISLSELDRLDPVLNEEISLREQAKKLNVAHGGTYTNYDHFSYGKGDKFQEAFEPLRRYLRAAKKRGFKFANVNPKEAARRIKVIDAAMEDLAAMRADLEPRSVAPKVVASAERRRINGT